MRQFILPLIFCLLLYSCYDDTKFTDSPSAYLTFSLDTVKFDTVFTTIGSTTRQLRVYNRNNKAVRTSVELESSYYRLNIDGTAANKVDNLEIHANDSAYIFVEVTIDPQDSNSPIVILDSILFNTNGNIQNVKLMSYGQDVHLLNDSIIGNSTWDNDKPYLIYNSVLVDTLCTLNIDAGARIYFHNNSSLLVKGQLHINGTLAEPVVLQGDRLDNYYSDKAGQWGANYLVDGTMYYFGNIHILSGSTENTIDYAIIKNGTKGIQIDNHTDDATTLTIANTQIQNMSIAGIYAQNANLLVYNTVISKCDYYAVALVFGGHYDFVHTTIANYTTARSSASVVFNNYYTTDETAYVFDFDATFTNSIIYGALTNEFAADGVASDEIKFDFEFNNCMLKFSSNINNNPSFRNVICSADSLPRFVNPAEYDFRLDTLSAAKDRGTNALLHLYPIDIDGIERDSLPDLGAYERVEK